MQVIGLCRFSYPAIGGFQVEHDAIQDRIRYLYGAQRIEERFRLFETFALPCLKEQTDPDFTMVLVIGDQMPREHVQRLMDLTSGMKQIRIEAHPPRNHREIMKEILNRARINPSDPCLQFRFDDDDAISVDFVERLRQTAVACQGLLDQNRTVAIDFNKGFVAEVQGHSLVATQILRPYYTAALGMYAAGGCARTIMNFAHQKIHHHMPTITMADAPMWVRTHNGYNDSRQGKVKHFDMTPLTREQESEFQARFALDVDLIRQTFSSDREG
ncbi:putative rhamnosyl transferase [Rhodobacteraceae bacterium M382]|nr:putative rhamnosyl transferase [Rhodobacteraceae bacterium M382]